VRTKIKKVDRAYVLNRVATLSLCNFESARLPVYKDISLNFYVAGVVTNSGGRPRFAL